MAVCYTSLIANDNWCLGRELVTAVTQTRQQAADHEHAHEESLQAALRELETLQQQVELLTANKVGWSLMVTVTCWMLWRPTCSLLTVGHVQLLTADKVGGHVW